MRPVFIDNRDGNTLHKAITSYLKALRDKGAATEELWIASAYFNPRGLELLAEETQYIRHIRLMLGAEPIPEASIPQRKPNDPPEPEYRHRHVQAALTQMEKALRDDRDFLPFDSDVVRAIRRLLDFLNSGKIETRRYKKHFLHAKAFIFRGKEHGVLSGSSNLSRAGMQTNLELNLGHYEDPLVEKIEHWYEELWDQAESFDLASIYEELFNDYSPYLIYLKVLWHLYEKELGQEKEEMGHIPVTVFQKHGVWRARHIIKQYGGVLIADGVGLGKTFTAGEIIRLYRERRQRVLLLRPAALKSTWDKFFYKHDLMVESLSYEQLARDAQLGGDQQYLNSDIKEDYALIVIDEAHNYRNPDAPMRAGVLRTLLSGRRRDLVLLSATPVNNSLWDLYHLLSYFLKQEAVLADHGVSSLYERFKEAMNIDPFNLHPDLLYPIIDATTVKRTRRFVKKYYSNDQIPGPDGNYIPIIFPKPVAKTIKYNLEKVLPGYFSRLEEVLMPEDGIPKLTMARYKPENYPAGQKPTVGDSALVGLLRSGMLKRFESSSYAFHCTLERMIRNHKIFLEALDHEKVISSEFLKELSSADDETDLDELLEISEHTVDANAFNVEALRTDVKADIALLTGLASEVAKIKAIDSPKLGILVDQLAAISEQAKVKSIDEDDECQKRKVIIFSYFTDTINWMEEYLQAVLENDPRLAAYRGRIASVTSEDTRNGISRENAIYGFAPHTTEAPPVSDIDRYDLLLCTDVLAEGVNLQQCGNIINFDLPWNPMRLVQRHGRIDRIGSKHRTVFLRTFFPDQRLDALLNLEERVRRKLAQAAASVGVEHTPIERGATGDQSFAEARDEIEKLHKEDASIYEAGGTEGAAQTGEEYRQELRKKLEEGWGEEIERLPWKASSGMVKGKYQGHFFCAIVEERIFLRFVPDKGQNNEIIKELGTCLRLIECTEDTPRTLSVEMTEAAYEAWKRARESIYNEWEYRTDPANLQPKVPKLNREVAVFLRNYPPPDIDQQRLNRCIDSVESPWRPRAQIRLRFVFNQEFQNAITKSNKLIEEIEQIGIEPYQVPEPLPPIDQEDIHLICWMALVPE